LLGFRLYSGSLVPVQHPSRSRIDSIVEVMPHIPVRLDRPRAGLAGLVRDVSYYRSDRPRAGSAGCPGTSDLISIARLVWVHMSGWYLPIFRSCRPCVDMVGADRLCSIRNIGPASCHFDGSGRVVSIRCSNRPRAGLENGLFPFDLNPWLGILLVQWPGSNGFESLFESVSAGFGKWLGSV
jgi:hypothetical protein